MTPGSSVTWDSEAGFALAARVGDLWTRLERPELAGGSVYWLESQAPAGTCVLLRRTPAGDVDVVSPPGVDVRNGVHEYGGGAFAVRDGTVVLSSGGEGRLVRIDPDGRPEPLTPVPPRPDAVRYGDIAFAAGAVVCVREVHGPSGVVNELVRVPLTGGEPVVLAAGRDFYSSPSASPDGRSLAWTAWDHPGMPFIGCELWCATVSPDGSLTGARHVAGSASESIFQPQFDPGGRLHYVSDRTGWWNLYREGELEPLGPIDAELGWPQWFLGLASYSFLDDGRIAALVNRGAEQRLAYLRPHGAWHDAALPFRHVAWPHLRGDGRWLVYVAAEPGRAPALVVVDSDTDRHQVLRSSLPQAQPGGTTVATPLETTTADGRVVHSLLYRPLRQTTDGRPPPLVVLAHGGPTDQTAGGLRVDVQLLTSRGYAAVDVDYAGSTGYGREFRSRLAGQWGVVDVGDCVAVATSLAADGVVDGKRMAVMGGSAGGYVTLCALAFHDVFRAGISFYGIADPDLWDAETHKFESSYTGWLAGEDARAPARAPSFSGPLLLLQGTEDRIVTPANAEQMAAAYERAGLPVELLWFPGEGHGFRREESLLRAHGAVLDFLGRVFL
jgi:dipeptidyl aminopeptidase/acylaminoacyl peptidase